MEPTIEGMDEVRALLERGPIRAPLTRVSVLGGGISNRVLLIESGNDRFVFKQALDRLRVKDEWLADRSRLLREVACLKAIRNFVGPQWAPEVLAEWTESFACLMEAAPEGSRTWKDDLLKGTIDPSVTQKVIHLMSALHRTTRGHPEVKQIFKDQTNFIQLRIDPYFITIGQRHPDLKEKIESCITPLFEGFCLVHGDFSPKNLLLHPDGRLWLLDCEVGHYGNPVFDLSFCANHLLLKSIHLNSRTALQEARRLWTGYWSALEGFPRDFLEPIAVKTLALLLLARVDGKSPVEYLSEQKRQVVRQLARTLIAEQVDRFEELSDAVSERL
ncbi:MAG: aminoglycoside phosphotransferase family protein [Armatimonadetes bacterium]|nr:aminoglycoside phosphotransferase family protein [Armatimonadota bacterium]MDW8120707.1 aminoglycoside phosphotransferase family protein [Armatimonadota bacterium]